MTGWQNDLTLSKGEEKTGENATVPASKFHTFIWDWGLQKLSVSLFLASWIQIKQVFVEINSIIGYLAASEQIH
jgi:hypothetical protein